MNVERSLTEQRDVINLKNKHPRKLLAFSDLKGSERCKCCYRTLLGVGTKKGGAQRVVLENVIPARAALRRDGRETCPSLHLYPLLSRQRCSLDKPKGEPDGKHTHRMDQAVAAFQGTRNWVRQRKDLRGQQRLQSRPH